MKKTIKLQIDKRFNVIANEYGKAESKLTKAKEFLNEFMRISKAIDEDFDPDYSELIGRYDGFLVAEVSQAFQKGAEFGYNKAFVEADKNLKAVVADFNKANEWHKQEVDDIYDLIAEDWSIRYFICVMKDWNHVTAIGSCDEGCSGEVSVNLFFEHDDEKYHIDDIVWWKEIVFPELPKEIK